MLTEKYISDSDIVPDDIQNELLYWSDKIKQGYFSIGDIANHLIARSAEKHFPVGTMQIYDAVGRFVGKSGRTIRYYAETASFFSDEIREEFDMLPFSHFVFARSMGAEWREVLEFASEKPHITREGLEAHFVQTSGVSVTPRTEVPRVSEDFGETREQKIETGGNTPPVHRRSVLISAIGRFGEYLAELSRSATLKDATVSRIERIRAEIDELISEILEEND
jgi:hypothetical protein